MGYQKVRELKNFPWQLKNVPTRPFIPLPRTFSQAISRSPKKQSAEHVSLGNSMRGELRAQLFGALLSPACQG